MAAALLSANVQALVRGLGSIDAEPLQLTLQINDHLARYTPDDRYVPPSLSCSPSTPAS